LAVETLESLKKGPVGDLVPETTAIRTTLSMNGATKAAFSAASWVIDDPVGYNTSRRIR